MYSLPAILQKAATLEARGMARNAAYIEAIKAMYPGEYEELLTICKGNGTSPETAIPELVEFLIREQGIKTSPVPETKKPQGQGLNGFEKMAEYARRSA